ncbi:hypothetical protein L9F63_006324 [Diploptera punctata]|uniref:Uncharacterized protein n=1 Tax=Diploptera punctata TaxID=6984 RepID=A0AAD7ZAV4_DIPPU|nr:hypothetical protein L9F63_006324 [Diploptera punctata]
MLLVAELKFLIAVQRRYRQQCVVNAPKCHTILKWYNLLFETDSVLRKMQCLQLELKMLGKHFSAAQKN